MKKLLFGTICALMSLSSISLATVKDTNNHAPMVKEATAVTKVDSYSGYILGNKAVRSAFPKNWEYKQDVTLKFDENSDLTWTVSSARKKSNGALDLGLMDDEATARAVSIVNNEDPNSDWFNISSALVNSNPDVQNSYTTAIVSNGYIENVTDFHFYFGMCEAGFVSVLYLEEGAEEWQIVKTDDGEPMYFAADDRNTAGTGVKNAWNQSAYHNGSSWMFTTTLKGKTARIAFTYTQFGGFGGNYMQLNAIEINTLNSAVNFMNKLANEEGICDKIANNTNQYKSVLELINYKITTEDLNALAEMTFDSALTSERNYYSFYSYLLNYAGIANSDPLGLNNNAAILSNDNLIVIIVISSLFAVSIISVLTIKAKKMKEEK